MLILVGSGRALGTLWRLSTDTSLVVGRKDSPLLIEGDKSVSRVHATVIVLAENLSGVDVHDEGSKFGIYINGKQCPSGSTSRLRVGDTIIFGAQNSVFHLRRHPIALCVANMRSGSPAAVDRVLAAANSLGMDIVDDIERCTHLVMPVLAITTKLIRALVFGCHVVSPEYIYSLEALPLSFKIPNPSAELVDKFVGSLKFMPPAQAPAASSGSPIDLSAVRWSTDSRRQYLFGSKLFVFAEASQMNKYSSLIKAAGGNNFLLKEAADLHLRLAEGFQTLCASLADKVQALSREERSTSEALPLKCLVLPPSPPDASSVQSDYSATALVTEVARLLGVRPISESEIGLAVLFVSCETHTNPAHGLPPETPLSTAEAHGPSATAKAGGVCQDNMASVSTLGPTSLSSRRRVPRISSFWNEKVSADASTVQASDPMTSANLEGARASMEALSVVSPTSADAPVSDPAALEPVAVRSRRRAGLDRFWANAVLGSSQLNGSIDEMQSATDSAGVVSASDKRVTQSASTPLCTNTEPQQRHGMAAVERIPLMRPNQRAPTCQAEHSSGAPNFKRFKKTVHPYQLV
ncbi:hypothetical protein GGI20_004073 [Coemansia sp. BCRC 34301]|nr:hypothetical protein GGI20_004073 [Coemansia sp. BCRC 34301]